MESARRAAANVFSEKMSAVRNGPSSAATAFLAKLRSAPTAFLAKHRSNSLGLARIQPSQM